MRETDVVVVGGGLIGSAVAREVALRGLRVVLFDAGSEPERASWAAAGMLSPQAEADRADDFLDLLLHSRSLYPAFVADVERESGLPTGYRAEGTLVVALTREDEIELRRRLDWQRAAGLEVEWLERDEVLRVEPAIAPGLLGALRFAGDHQVDNRLLAVALRAAARRAGVVVRDGVRVTGLVSAGGRVAGVELEGGGRVAAGWVVVAGGIASGELQGLPRPLPLRPVHGELLAVRSNPPLLRHVVDSPRVYLVPRSDGRLIIGATSEDIGVQRRTTEGGRRALLAAAVELVPELEQEPIVEHWSGLRPGTPDGHPILGTDPALDGLVIATGHYRNGVLLTPATARAVADLILGVPTAVDLSGFAPDRFS